MNKILLTLLLIAAFLLVASERLVASEMAPAPKHGVTKVSDVKWASPRGFDLTMDIYTPQTGRKKYPVIIMYHGGGWLINNKSIMDEASAWLAGNGEYVVCNVNYRLLGDLDNSVTMDEIVGDAFGALLWVKENIKKYGGDKRQITVTGDSAGGHLATMVATQGDRVSADAAFEAPDYGFRPSYIPEKGISRKDLQVQAALISYGAFDMLSSAQNGFESSGNIFWQMSGAEARGMFGKEYNPKDNPDRYKAVSPIYNIEKPAKRTYPRMLFTVGSDDNVTTPASIKAYTDKLKAAGQVDHKYWLYGGRPHAFLDSGSNEFLGIEFKRDAIPALEYMLKWLDGVFYA
jgi:acetyl esterase/lipase